MNVYRTLLILSFVLLAGCSSTPYYSQNTQSSQYEMIEIDAIKPPNLTLLGDSAYYADDVAFSTVGAKKDSARESTADFVPVEKQPTPLRVVNPKCPPGAQKQSITGDTRVKMLIDTLGIPRKARLVESSNKVFNDCSLIASMQWRFSPAMMLGKPVSVWVSIPFRFRNCH